jgi:hypothetical protein
MNIQNVHIHLDPAAASAAAAALFAPQAIFATRSISSPVPKIGSYWEGEGGVYAGFSRGWGDVPDGHLIVPTDQRACFEDVKLGTHGIDVKGATSERDGLGNTKALAEAGSALCKAILGLEIEGHSDYFLMARRDGALCYANVPELFETNEWYLLSTQFSASSAWDQDFDGGGQDHYGKKFSARARACRRLIL